MKQVLFIVIVVFITSCTSYDEELKTLNKLSLKLDTAEVNMSKIDSVFINSNNQLVKENVELVEAKYKDVLARNQIYLFGKYKKINKSIRRFNRAFVSTNAEIKLSRNQINNLSSDIEHNRINDKQVIETYLADEVKAVSEVHEYSFEMYDWYNKTNKVFNELQPKVKSLVDSLESKKQR